RITGEGQIFEASFGWVIEDGHKELSEGFATTDAGAPAWGKFSFEVKAEKERQNSTLHLVLFETSMKDGSRQYELPIRLY
ncbi:MAG: Gmad2 immunoglobulin-like domain-containing protein, partial [Flavisolibacter sp.]